MSKVESLQCIHVGDQEGLRFCTLEQNRPYHYRQLQFHTLCGEFITEQASPILRRTSGRQ